MSTANVPTVYGTITVAYEGNPTDEELYRMAMDKAQEKEKLSKIQQNISVNNQPSGFSPINSTPVDEEEEPEDDLFADIAKGFMRVAEIPESLLTEAVLGMTGLNTMQKEAFLQKQS